ncbi:chemotaxis protein CheW [Candidatus Nitrospira nitrificans]|uniref:Chemotaxis protein CheW (Modular protein) n=1 Tax=Candidatus Nitrospira nitrificans TaxID=1742973 RepID=A0A0S4LPZ8_9BACT|nr:chemotaxis protein CheW [Candidatus Nitrospira nitrificans]CUS39022.1 Putative Chemotaxis protein CheW (modular protein) [Candidatus Nitrospira nitrificans]
MIPIDELPRLHSDSVPGQAKSTESLRVCLVALGDETFAIDVRQVREVFEPKSITPVPGMPAALVGVTNLRGTIIPLTDLRNALGISASVMPKYAVVIRQGMQQVGILVQEVPEIRTIQSDDLVAPSTRTAAERRPMISAFFKTENKLSAILELSRLLASIEGTADDQRSHHHGKER